MVGQKCTFPVRSSERSPSIRRRKCFAFSNVLTTNRELSFSQLGANAQIDAVGRCGDLCIGRDDVAREDGLAVTLDDVKFLQILRLNRHVRIAL